MNTREFCKELTSRITQAEWDALERWDPSLTVNGHNRMALLEMRAMCAADGQASRQAQPWPDVDLDAAENLAHYLQEYLDEYMSDALEGHKWIVLASLYLAYVAHRPLHPIERTAVSVERVEGATIYRCPLKISGDIVWATIILLVYVLLPMFSI